jgi:UDP-galactopyranose mutase
LAERHRVLVIGSGFGGLSVATVPAMQQDKNLGRVMRAQLTGNGSVARMRSSGFTHHRGERSITLEQTDQVFKFNHLLQKWA